MASAVVNLPIVWRTIADKAIFRKLTIETIIVMASGIIFVVLDRVFLISEMLVRFIK
jgi:hypothetical protein